MHTLWGYPGSMTTATDDTQMQPQLPDVVPGESFRRVVLTVIGAIGTVVGWITGRGLIFIGWFFGRIWLVGAFFVEAIIYGFRVGAKLPLTPPDLPPQG